MSNIHKVGFTGTQEGMSKGQKDDLRELLIQLFVPGVEFHHGDCIGADTQAASIARELKYKIVAHPPQDTKKQAFHDSDEHRIPMPYLDRNANIVTETHILLAAPRTNVRPKSLRGSGTWWTIVFAEKRGGKVIILPRGEVK
jgi:hypothetical protein